MLGRRGCVGVERPLTEAEVRAQGHVEQIRKKSESTLEITCGFALFGIKSNRRLISNGSQVNVLEACEMKVKPLSTLQHVLTTGSAQACLECALRATCPCLLLISFRFLHSPRWLTQSQTKAVAPNLPVQERFGQDIGHHVLSWAVDHVDGPAHYDFVDEVDMDVNVLHTCVVVVILHKFECSLVVAEERGCHIE